MLSAYWPADVQRRGWNFTSCAVFCHYRGVPGIIWSFGIYGRAAQREEISIRLVLGASLQNILRLLTQNVLKLVLIAFILAAPIALATIGYQSILAGLTCPVGNLRSE